ncbi:LicD family-domain-containing protein [Bisporella sp. PMI_857]|nr:LicD family-domain-containing protein [Bisporella sp. PMI_857]
MRRPFCLTAFLCLQLILGVSVAAPAEEIEKSEQKGADLDPKKYFHEPGGDNSLGHYDIRYFNGAPVSYEEKSDTLYHMIRAYLLTFRDLNIETWVAHGTLLGWWWNGQIMPWDWDLDTQVSGTTLAWLGENLNMTFHNYTSTTDNGTVIFREYLLDVNPHAKERVRGDGMNVIDARWIDVRNGLFIDITGLSETDPVTQPGVWSCKNYHHYRTRDLYPLRTSVFEGVPALIPYSFDKILTKEYGSQALTSAFHEGHQWHAVQKEWVKIGDQQVLNDKQRGRDRPHVPHSLQPKRQAGLRNLLHLL